MKRLTGYILCFLGLCLMFTATYYLSFRNALREFNKNAVERDYNFVKSLEEYKKQGQLLSETNEENVNVASKEAKIADISATKDNSGMIDQGIHSYDMIKSNFEQSILDDSLSVDANATSTVLPSTKYYLETYEVSSSDLVREEKSLPSDLVGLTRAELIDKLANYMSEIPLDDYEKGLVSYELLSFSEKEVILRKTYNQDLVTFKYYVAVKDGKVIVYYSDLKTVYEYTSIEAIQLPEEARTALMQGIYVKDSQELFSLLESYSS